MKKAIFIDLDGTLFNDQKQVSQANIEALARAKAAGHEIVISTGRSFDYVEAVNQECGNVCRYSITSTGNIVYDYHEKKILALTNIQPQYLPLLYDLFSHPELTLLVHCTDGLYSTAKVTTQRGVEKLITQPLRTFLPSKTICNITVTSHNLALIKDLYNKVLKLDGIYISNCSKTISDPSFPLLGVPYFDIIVKGTSKGLGVKTLCAHLGVGRENRICIGDDINDISMFGECDTKVAMGNALPKIKEIASHTTADNNNDGVAKFLLAIS